MVLWHWRLLSGCLLLLLSVVGSTKQQSAVPPSGFYRLAGVQSTQPNRNSSHAPELLFVGLVGTCFGPAFGGCGDRREPPRERAKCRTGSLFRASGRTHNRTHKPRNHLNTNKPRPATRFAALPLPTARRVMIGADEGTTSGKISG